MPSEDDEMLWTKEVDHENNSYLLLVNHSGRTMKAGEQIMFFYGRYTNAYLLVNYGFCYRDNKYDQIDVLLELKPPSLFPKDFVCFDFDRDEGVQDVQLKSDILNSTLLCYCRLLVQTEKKFHGE